MQLSVERIETLIAPDITADGMELCGIRMSGNYSNPLIQVFVDYRHTSVTIDDCVNVTRLVQARLETITELRTYRLEVSSPGIDWPMTQLWQFTKNTGKLLRKQQGAVTLEGRIASIEESGAIILQFESGETTSYSLDDLYGAKIVLETFSKPKQKVKRKRNETRGR